MKDWWMRSMELVNMVDGESDGGGDSSVDFGDFFGGGGATGKNDEVEGDDDSGVDTDDGDLDEGDDSDGDTDDEDGVDGDDDGDGDDEDETDDSDSTTVSLAAIKQQQQILADLLKKQVKEETVVEETPEVDPFESEEFTRMKEVMNWDDEEADAARVFFQKFIDWGNKKAIGEMSRQTPQMVETTIQQNERIRTARESFYTTHPMLNEVKPFVGQIAQGVAHELGESATMEAVLEESAKRAYKALGLDPKIVANTVDKINKKAKVKPAFPVKKGARKQTVKAPKLQQEIDAIIGA